MSDRTRRILEALGGAALTLFIVRWIDSDVISGIDRAVGSSFDPLPAEVASSLGYLMIAAAVILIVVLARRAAGPWVGIAYTLVGAALTFMSPVAWFLTVKGNTPAILTGPLADILDRVWIKAEQGPLNSVAIFGAVMLLVGLMTIGSAIRRRGKTVPQAPIGPLSVPASSP